MTRQQPPPKSLQYYALPGQVTIAGVRQEYLYAYCSATSKLLASAISLEALHSACTFLGYTKQKESK